MKVYGLIGHPLVHSFSRDYFTNKFNNEELDCCYLNFDIDSVSDFENIVKSNPNISGLNVTIPYKQQIINHLGSLNPIAEAVSAVNTIKFENGEPVGYNTDVTGFEALLDSVTDGKQIGQALILGSGGASKAVAYVLKSRNIPFSTVSRTCKGDLTYGDLIRETVESVRMIINTTPLGMYPNTDSKPCIPYSFLTDRHICIDLVYNPEETEFLRLAKKQGAKAVNGMQMLVAQAEASWKIWNSKS